MIPVSNDYRRQLIAGNRNYLIKVNMTLADNTTIELTNANIWDNGIVINEAISSDSSFDLGAAIIGSLKIIIDNINGNYSQYDFYDARLVLWLGVAGDVDEYDVQRYYRIGFYVVDEPNYNGSLITLNCLDNMTWFDVPFENITTQATTAGQLVAAICSQVGVTLGTVAFPNYTTVIDVEFDKTVNCREVLQYVAQMCCCYCKIDRAGELVLKWYNKQEIIGITDYDGGTYHTITTPYSDGCDLDGGHFNPWDGDSADGGTFGDLLNGAVLSQNFSIDVSTDDVVITGCRVRNNTSQDDPYDELWVDPVVEQNHDRYVLVIENNPFITSTNAAAIANTVGSTLAGLPVRGFKATSLSDFSYETGDMVMIIDFRGNRYYTWITSFTFTTNNSEEFSCGVESLRKRSEERYSSSTKTLAEANENASAILTDYDRAVKAMNELAQNAIGYNKYEGAIDGKTVTWLYNGFNVDITDPSHPLFADSTVVFEISGDGVFVSNDGGQTYDNGYDANSGTAILSLLYTIGLTSDWIRTGTLDVGGLNNEDGIIRVTNRDIASSETIENTDVYKWLYIGSSQINKSGTYRVFYTISDVEAGKDEVIQCQIQKRDLWDGSTYTYKVIVDTFDITENYGELPIKFDVDTSNPSVYYAIKYSRVVATNAGFTVTNTYNKVNTIIDRNGVNTTMLTAEGGEIAGYTINHPVNGNGLFYNKNDIYAEYSVNKMHLGARHGSYWSFTATANGGEFLHIDYGGSNTGGLWITNNGENNVYNFSGGAMHITKSSVSCDAHGEVEWSGSDRKLKKNIKKLTLKKAKELIFSVIPREFEMKARKGKRYGFIAQELRETLSDDSGIEFESNGIRNINYNDFIAPLCMVVKKQQEEIDLLKQEIALLKKKAGE